jgi:hypothetical protein
VTGQCGRPSHNKRARAGTVETLTARWQRLPAAVSAGPWVLVFTVLLVLAACSGDGGVEGADATSTTGEGVTTTSALTATTATTEDQKAVVLAAYRAFWADVVAAGKTADWQSPRLARHATGKVLARVRGQFRALDSQGFVALGTIKVSPRVVRLAGEKATVQDCVDTSRFRRYDPKNKRWLDQLGGQPDGQRSTLTLDGQGNWKVAESVVAGTCAGG